jgi:hypothetical protein
MSEIRPRALCAAALAAVLALPPACAQQSATTPGQPGGATPQAPAPTPAQPAAPKEPQPLPYGSDEFPQWLSDLRRGEIVTVGSFPIVYLFTQLGYNVYRYGIHGWDLDYAPLGNANRVPYTRGETIGVLLGAASLSALVATADYLLGRARAKKAVRGASRGSP